VRAVDISSSTWYIEYINIKKLIFTARDNEKVAIVETQKKQLLEIVSMGLHQNKNGLSDREVKELKQLIEERFDKRVKLLEEKKSIWDYTIELLQVVSGMVD
jgi:hypothetical protein